MKEGLHMVTNISVMGNNSYLSVGQYNTATQVMQLWVYATRFLEEDGNKYALIRDFDMAEYRQTKKVELVDIDWDIRGEMTFNQFKKLPVKDGYRKVNATKVMGIK